METATTKIGTKLFVFKSPGYPGLFTDVFITKIDTMDRFTKEIKVGKENMIFEFTRMQNMNGVKFFITSKDANQKPIAFSVRQTGEGNWTLMPGALRWLYDIEDELSNAVIDTRLH